MRELPEKKENNTIWYLGGLVGLGMIGWFTLRPTPPEGPKPVATPTLAAAAPITEGEPLPDYVRRTGQRWACSSFLKGKRVGYLIYETRVEGDSAVEVCESYVKPPQRAFLQFVYRTEYSLKDGTVLTYDKRSVGDGRTTTIHAERTPQGYQIAVDEGGLIDRRTVTDVKENLAGSRDLDAWLTGKAGPGDSNTRWDTEWDSKKDVNEQTKVTFEGRGEIGHTPVFRSTWGDGTSETKFATDANSHLIHSVMAGIFEERASSEAEARDKYPPPVLTVKGTFDPSQPVKLEVTGPPPAVVENGRQHLEGHTLTVSPDGPDVKGTEPAPTEEELKGVAPAGPGTPLERIQGALAKRSNVPDTLARLRKAGVPAREVGGLRYGQREGSYSLGRWLEAWDGTRWVSVDPARQQIYVDAGYVKLVDPNPLGVCGLVEFTVSP